MIYTELVRNLFHLDVLDVSKAKQDVQAYKSLPLGARSADPDIMDWLTVFQPLGQLVSWISK